VEELEGFWESIWRYFEVRAGHPYHAVLSSRSMPDARWFEGSSLNFAEHLLRGGPNALAVIGVDETGLLEELTYRQLVGRVSAAQAGLRSLGIEVGDRVVAYMPNRVETLVAFLAVAGLGAIWSSCAPDFGPKAVIDRFAQLEPKLLLAVDRYRYGGREYDRSQDLAEIRASLPTLEATLVHGRSDVFERAQGEITFAQVPFDHPLWVLYSSGTTGLPKGIVHGHGGILLEQLKQSRLHMDLGPEDRFFWFTTTGWMMWNVVASGLLSGGTIVLYDGSPGHPDLMGLWRLVDQLGITYFGTSAGYVQSCLKAGIQPAQELGLQALRTIGSTGSPLSVDGFRWLRDSVKAGIPVASMSGGTDVCSSFLTASPLLPVYAGELQCAALGVDAAAFDEAGRPVVGEVGELVVRAPMPSMPIRLWNDPDGSRYRETYFSKYPGVWRHGDWVEFTERGSAVIYGRSDSTLNRGGVRMGTSEFYSLVEGIPDVLDSLVVEVGPNATETQLFLFVVTASGRVADERLVESIRKQIRAQLSPRHVPDRIISVPEVPRTLTGKKLEVPVKRLLAGEPLARVVSLDSIANPRALDPFVVLAGTLKRDPDGRS
jgi:acetoacetyl-CoA synthetase